MLKIINRSRSTIAAPYAAENAIIRSPVNEYQKYQKGIARKFNYPKIQAMEAKKESWGQPLIIRKKTMYTKEENIYFESRMAIGLSMHPEWFPSVTFISEFILQSIKINRSLIIDIFATDAGKRSLESIKIDLYRTELSGPLGAIVKDKDALATLTIEEVLTDIEKRLDPSNPPDNLIQIMPVHATFAYRIARLLYADVYKEFEGRLSTVVKFIDEGKKGIKRKAAEKDIPITTQFGVSDSEELTTKINASIEAKNLSSKITNLTHKTSMQRFASDPSNPILQDFITNNLPVIAGPSTHTVSLLNAAMVYVKLKDTILNLMEYSFAYYCFMATAGYHTFHEVMSVATQCLINASSQYIYDYGTPSFSFKNYHENIPEMHKDAQAFIQKLILEIADPFQVSIEGLRTQSIFAPGSSSSPGYSGDFSPSPFSSQ